MKFDLQLGAFKLNFAPNLNKKGSLWPFNRVPPIDGAGMGGEKMSEPYRNSAWVMRAIKLITGPVSSVPLVFVETGANGKEVEIEDPALTAFWDAPAITTAGKMAREDFFEATIGWIKLKGEAFWIKDDSWLVPFPEVGQRAPLILARPDRMNPVKSEGKVIGWTYNDAAGKRHTLSIENVVHLKCWNPYDEVRGLAEWDTVSVAGEADYLAGVFNRELMRNNGDHGIVVSTTDNQPLDDDQRKQIVNELRRRREMTLRGQFAPTFLYGNLKIEDPKIQRPDSHWVAARLENRHEIFIAFGVPASMADVAQSYSIGSASDRYRLIEDTCIPTGKKICAAITEVVRIQTKRNITARLDWDDHSTMQAVRRERLDSAQKLWTSGWSWSAINDYLGLEMQPFPGWDVPYVPMNVVAVDGGKPPTPPELNSATNETDKVDLAIRALKQRAANQPHQLTPKQLAIWRSHMAKRLEARKMFKSRFSRELMKARAETLAKIAKYAPKGEGTSTPTTKSVAADLVFNLVDWVAGLKVGLRSVQQATLQKAGDELFKELSRDDAFLLPPEKAIQFIRSRDNRLSGVADEVHAKIMRELEEGLNAGETMKQLADRTRAAFNEIEDGRAKTVATQETNTAYEFARREGMKQAGIERKAWLHSQNIEGAREEHLAAGEEYADGIPLDQPFIVMGEELMYPCDPDGSPENTINCHCVCIPVANENPEEP